LLVYGDPSGDRLDIAAAELEAIMEASGQRATVKSEGGLVICQVQDLLVETVARAAYIQDIGELLYLAGEMPSDATKFDFSKLEGRTFKVDAEGFSESSKRSIDEAYGEWVLRSAEGSSVRMKDPDAVVRVVKKGKMVFVGITTPRGRGKWVKRRPRARAFFHPSALFPKLARLMVNLSAVGRGETFLDPFSGTGSTVIEACLVGAYGLGLDLDKRMVFGGRRNLRGFGLDRESQVLRGDARFLPFREVDAIAGDVPYGRASSTKGAASKDLLEAVLVRGGRCLRRGGRLVVMHQKSAQVGEPKGFEVLGEYEFYVHRSLTRVISVLRKS
jgi:tRNA (guanine10-N2)-dimethyltransferase